MTNELQLQTGPYRTTFIGTEITRQSTKEEWENYGEILRRVDEAKQWAIGDWLVDGKRHYGDGVYGKAAKITLLEESTLRAYKSQSEILTIAVRNSNLTHGLPRARREGKQKAVELKGYGLSTPRVQGGELLLSDRQVNERVYPVRVGRGTISGCIVERRKTS